MIKTDEIMNDFLLKVYGSSKQESHHFVLGDIVYRPGVEGPGIVVKTSPTKAQAIIHCIFKANEFELRREITRLRSLYPVDTKPYVERATPYQKSQLYFVRNEISWFQPPSKSIISKDRFLDIIEEEES